MKGSLPTFVLLSVLMMPTQLFASNSSPVKNHALAVSAMLSSATSTSDNKLINRAVNVFQGGAVLSDKLSLSGAVYQASMSNSSDRGSDNKIAPETASEATTEAPEQESLATSNNNQTKLDANQSEKLPSPARDAKAELQLQKSIRAIKPIEKRALINIGGYLSYNIDDCELCFVSSGGTKFTIIDENRKSHDINQEYIGAEQCYVQPAELLIHLERDKTGARKSLETRIHTQSSPREADCI